MSLYQTFATGRTRTVKLEGTFDAPANMASINVITNPAASLWQGYFNYGVSSDGSVSWNGFVVRFSAAQTIGSISGNEHFHLTYGLTVDSSACGFAGGEIHNASVNFGDLLVMGGGGFGLPPQGDLLAGANVGTVSLEFDVEEYVAVGGFLPLDGTWPPLHDGVLSVYPRFEEFIKVGPAVVRVSVTSSAGNYSKSFDNAVASRGIGNYQPILQTHGFALGRYQGGDAVEIMAECAGIALGFVSTYTFNDPGPPIVVDGSSVWLNIFPLGSYPRGGFTNNSGSGASTTLLAGWGPPGEMSLTQLPTMLASVDGLIFDFGGDLLAEPGMKANFYCGGSFKSIDASGGTILANQFLENVGLSGFGPNNGFSNFNEYKIFAYLSATGSEDPLDTALVGGWKSWNSISIEHALTTVIEDFSSATGWAAGTNATVSVVGGKVQIAAAGGDADATKTYATPFNSEGYRYAVLEFRSLVASNVTVRLTVGQKYWDVKTIGAGLYATPFIDLMCPDGELSVLATQQDSRWPVDNATSNTPANEARYWGVNRFVTLKIANIPDGETIELDALDLTRQRNATSHFAVASSDSALVQYITGAPVYVRRLLLCQSDGRQTLEASDGFASISQFVLECQKIPGFTVVDLGGIDAYFTNGNVPPYFLAGGEGILLSGTSYLESDITAVKTVKAQYVFDVLGFYPGCGDVLGLSGGAYGGSVLLSLMPKVLRGQGHGLVHDAFGKPVVGQTVRLVREPGDVPSGQGVSDDGGYFKTGMPYGIGGSSFSFVGQPPVTSIVVPPRKKVRINVGPISAITDVDDLQTIVGQHHVSFIANGDIWHRFSHTVEVQWAVETDVTGGQPFSGGWANPRLGIDPSMRVHLVCYHSHQGGSDPLANGIYYLYSDDNGRSFGPVVAGVFTPELISMSATSGMIACAQSGAMIEIAFFPDSGTSGPGTFQSRWKPVADADWSAFVLMKDQAAASIRSAGYGWGFDHAWESADRWTLSFVPDGGTSLVTYASADMGLTWTLLT